MTQISKATFNTTWADSAGTFADNTSRLISEGDLRQFAEDIKDSVPFNLDASIAQIQTVKVTISSAEILALNSTPKTLVAAQGAGTVIEWLSLTLFYDFNSIAYATNTTLALKMGSSAYYNLTGIISAGADVIYQVTGITSPIALTTNTALTLTVNTGNPTAGNSPLYAYVTYRVITL